MPRTFRLERDDNPFGRIQMTNQELVQSNQKLQGRVQKLMAAYQQVEQQNVMLRDRCLRLQNRVDELKAHLTGIKNDVGERVPPMRLIAGHLFEVANFLETLDNSIDLGTGPSRIIEQKCWNFSVDKISETKRTSLDVISEAPEA